MTDEDYLRGAQVDPEKQTMIYINMMITVRDNPRNSHLNSIHYFDNDDDKLRWSQQYAFGDTRDHVGKMESGKGDHSLPSSDVEAAPVQASLICKPKTDKSN